MRVVEKLDSGLYKISLGGKLMEARSNLQLEPGFFLRVQLKAMAGQIQLIPETTSNPVLQDVFRFTEVSFQNGNVPQQLTHILAALGLPVDGISGRLFSMIQQLGFQFDGGKLKKAYRIASQFPGRESQAAEVALLLLEKGIDVDGSDVAAILSFLLGDNNFFHQELNQDRDHHSFLSSQKDGKDFGGLEQLVEGLYGRSIASFYSCSQGLLTLFNHLATNTNHWLVVPFSMEMDVSEKSQIVGNIRILFNLSIKKIEKICVTAQSSSSDYDFVLYYGERGVKTLEYAEGLATWQSSLEKIFPGVVVRGQSRDKMGLFCNPTAELATCNLEV